MGQGQSAFTSAPIDSLPVRTTTSVKNPVHYILPSTLTIAFVPGKLEEKAWDQDREADLLLLSGYKEGARRMCRLQRGGRPPMLEAYRGTQDMSSTRRFRCEIENAMTIQL